MSSVSFASMEPDELKYLFFQAMKAVRFKSKDDEERTGERKENKVQKMLGSV